MGVEAEEGRQGQRGGEVECGLRAPRDGRPLRSSPLLASRTTPPPPTRLISSGPDQARPLLQALRA